MKETFWIDGYNLLFYLDEVRHLEKKREALLQELNELVDEAGVEVIIVFDGATDFKKTRFQALDVIYTPKGMTADDYIIEDIEGKKKRGHHLSVVSNDKHLCRCAKLLNVKTLKLTQFFSLLIKKTRKRVLPPPPKTLIPDREMDRLAKIFEERLKMYEEGKLD